MDHTFLDNESLKYPSNNTPRGSQSISQLFRSAKDALEGKWWIGIVGFVVLWLASILVTILIPCIGIVFLIFALGAMRLGTTAFYLDIANGLTPQISRIFSGFNRFGDSLIAFLLIGLFTAIFAFVPSMFLSFFASQLIFGLSRNFSMGLELNNTIQLIGTFTGILFMTLVMSVPAIIKASGYSMTWFIMNDEPNLRPIEAVRKSQNMMYGYKLKYFYIGFRFFLLSIACLFTCGIGILFLVPYAYTVLGKLYQDIKFRNLSEEDDVHVSDFSLGL
jgi:uncharacterized membrane protein